MNKAGENWRVETCPLTAEGVDQASELISEELQKFGLQSREIQRMRLSAEEILLCWLKAEDMKGTFRVEIGRRFRRITLTLRCMGPAVNPLADEGEEFGDQDPGYSILTALGLAPSWQYQDGVNIVTATQKTGKSMNTLLQILIGVTMLFIKDRVQELGQVISEANTLMMTILSALSAIIPLFVFLSVIRLILQGTLSESASGLIIIVLVCVAVMFLDVAVETLILMCHGFSFGEILKDMGPFFLIALTTSSSSAAFSQERDCLDEKIGVDRKMFGFALPFGNVVFMPAVVVFLILIPLYAAKLYGVELSFATLLLCLFNAVILSIAAPPVAGGGISIVTMMLMQLGVPLEACILAIAADAILEFPATAANLYDLAVQMICQADNMHLLSRGKKE